MKLKQWQNILRVTVSANSMVQREIQNKNRTTKNANMSVKIITCAKKIIG